MDDLLRNLAPVIGGMAVAALLYAHAYWITRHTRRARRAREFERRAHPAE
jgi:Flp pilus assembly protein TadB